ncbi:MAG: transcriptional regulator [Planctomycetes bacterium]|nr:transcriptional regulator [Planctomycetota bacterium]
MTTKHRTAAFRDLPKRFDELCRHFPLRPVHDGVGLENATEVIHSLAGHKLNKDQEDYLEALSELVGAYEDAQHAKNLSRLTPLDALRYLAEENGLTASALGDLLGNRSLGSKLLRGERELSKAHIQVLARHFKVSPALFVGG